VNVPTKLRITKIEAACRQIDTAIEMFFFDRDPVAIHTMVAASHEIVHALAKRKGVADLLFGTNMVKHEFHKRWNEMVVSDGIFFKHADEDPDGELEFNPESMEVLLMFTLRGLRGMGHRFNGLQAAYWTWFCLHHPASTMIDVFSLNLPSTTATALRAMPKADFVRTFQEAHRLEKTARTLAADAGAMRS
jgi:hypothetical protein